MSLYKLSNAKISREREKIVRKETEHIIDSSRQQKAMQVFVLGWHFVLTRPTKKEEEEILVVMSLFKEEKEKKYRAATGRDAYAHSHFVQESKEEREREREKILRMRQI